MFVHLFKITDDFNLWIYMDLSPSHRVSHGGFLDHSRFWLGEGQAVLQLHSKLTTQFFQKKTFLRTKSPEMEKTPKKENWQKTGKAFTNVFAKEKKRRPRNVPRRPPRPRCPWPRFPSGLAVEPTIRTRLPGVNKSSNLKQKTDFLFLF